MKIQRALAVIGAGVLLFAVSDAVTYAATGSSLVLGVLNRANAVTTIQNTGPGSALRLTTSSSATPPLVVNGKGKVTNLYSDRSATADNAAKLGGRTPAQVAADAVQHVTPARVLWVAKSGGNFTSVQAALASITVSGAAHPYVIKIAPGTYNEPGGIDMKDHVDLEGSGQDNTIITCACASTQSPYNGGLGATMRITGPTMTTEVRGLRLMNTGGNTYGTAVWNAGASPFESVKLTDVTLVAQGSVGNYGLWNISSSIDATNSRITASGDAGSSEAFGIANVANGEMSIRDVNVYGQGVGAHRFAVYNNGNFEADSSILNAGDIGIDDVGSSVAYVSMTSVHPFAAGTSSSFHCVGAFTAIYTPLSSTCT
jgi:pectin methylesterase-like acyl-CoA thioesterase